MCGVRFWIITKIERYPGMAAMGLKKDLSIIHNGTDEQAEEHTPSNIKMFEQIRFDGNYSKLENDLKTRITDYYKL